MKLIAVILIVLVLAIIIFLAAQIVLRGPKALKLWRRPKWEAVPREIRGGKTQMFLERGTESFRVGEPFASTDDLTLDERFMDAARMKKSLSDRR